MKNPIVWICSAILLILVGVLLYINQRLVAKNQTMITTYNILQAKDHSLQLDYNQLLMYSQQEDRDYTHLAQIVEEQIKKDLQKEESNGGKPPLCHGQ